MASLFSDNFSPLITQVKADVQRWSSLPLSLIGRINAVKMNILSKFLFLFQCIPLFLSRKLFRTIDEVISSFLWNKKAPRILKSLLQKCKFNGGLALPNFQLYYWSAHIHKITYWLKSSDTPWCRLEAQSCTLSSLKALFTSSLPLNPSGFTNNPVVRSTFQIWYQFRRHFKFQVASSRTPLTKNHLFPPSRTCYFYAVAQQRHGVFSGSI